MALALEAALAVGGSRAGRELCGGLAACQAVQVADLSWTRVVAGCCVLLALLESSVAAGGQVLSLVKLLARQSMEN